MSTVKETIGMGSGKQDEGQNHPTNICEDRGKVDVHMRKIQEKEESRGP